MENMLKELRSTVFLFHAFCDTVWLLDSGRFIDILALGIRTAKTTVTAKIFSAKLLTIKEPAG